MVKDLQSFAMNFQNDNISCNSVESFHWQPFLQLNLFQDEGCNRSNTSAEQQFSSIAICIISEQPTNMSLLNVRMKMIKVFLIIYLLNKLAQFIKRWL